MTLCYLRSNELHSSSLASSYEREYAAHINRVCNTMTYDDLSFRLDEYPTSNDDLQQTAKADKEAQSRSNNSAEIDDCLFDIDEEVIDDCNNVTSTKNNSDSNESRNNQTNNYRNNYHDQHDYVNSKSSDNNKNSTNNTNNDNGNLDFISGNTNSVESNTKDISSALDIMQTKSGKNVRFADDNDKDLVEIRTYLPTPPHTLLFSPELILHNFLQFRSPIPTKQTSQYQQQQLQPQPLLQRQQQQRQQQQPQPLLQRQQQQHQSLLHRQQQYCKPKTSKLKVCFEDPCTDSKKKESSVFLSKYSTTNRMITGIVLVKNIDFEKRVFVRYTVNNWKSHSDLEAFFITNTEEGLFDRFSFTLTLPSSAKCLEFAICFNTPGAEYWDNNDGKNYRVEEESLE